MVPETLTELRVESVFSLWLVPSMRASDLDGLRASQLWENHACRSEETGLQAICVLCYGLGRYGNVELSVVSILLLQDVLSVSYG